MSLQQTWSEMVADGRPSARRDYPRARTNYPASTIGFGSLFVLAGFGSAAALYFKTEGIERIVAVLSMSCMGGAGLFLMSLGYRTKRLLSRSEQRAYLPVWERDYPWDTTGTTDERKKSVRRGLLAVLGVAMFMTPFHLVPWAGPKGAPVPLYIVLGVFDLVILGMAGYTLYGWMQLLKYGENRVEYGAFPMKRGAKAAFTFRGNSRLANQKLAGELTCIHEYQVSRGAGRSKSTAQIYDVLHSEHRDFLADGSGSAYLEFELPAEKPTTDLLNASPTYWEFVAVCEQKGVDYRGIFLLPVY